MKKRSRNVAAEQGLAMEGQTAAEEGIKKVLPPLKRGALLALLICGIGCFAAIPIALYAAITVLNYNIIVIVLLPGVSPLIGVPLLAMYLFRRVERTLPKRERVGKLAWAALGITGFGTLLLFCPFSKIFSMERVALYVIKTILVLAVSIGQVLGLIAACTHHGSRKRLAVGLCTALLPLAVWDIFLIADLLSRVRLINFIFS